ncbi:hypothetical protein IWQ60_008822 [Tieghemiomyces parasiticus]|uniref:Citrate transporter-like domain-containing protein n=1 Tax=Tieghemiomyces parasiticus TaxID=78921 RepID=A0A9W7ZYJ7_9FUNG|nr:hypothetical protein IWQ60_008822 [Tieghemiomyces parasiticus]
MDPLTFRSWVLLALVVVVACFINAPQTLPVTRRLRLPLDLVTIPLLTVIIGLATTSISWADVGNGIAGSQNVQPYAILVLLLALAWVCVSLDMTGFLSMIALAVVKRGGRSGRRFFLVIFALSFVFTLVTNIDVAVLTLTPVTVYFTEAMQLSPYAFLLGEFFGSNISSMIFFMGNLNNIIVAEAYGMNFATYAAWMVLPALGSAAITGAVLLLQFRRTIPRHIELPDVNPRAALKEPRAAWVGTFLLMGMTVALAVSSFFAVSVWIVSLPFGVAACIVDVARDLWNSPPALDNKGPLPLPQRIAHRMPITWEVLTRLPYPVFPFTLCMFVIVQALTTHGWTPRLAWLLTQLCPDPTAAVFSVGFLSALASVVFNNIPATVLFVNALRSPEFVADDTTLRAAYLALAIGSDLGAHLTVPAGMAGLLWSSLARAKGVRFDGLRFVRAGIWTFPISVASACAILAAELAIMGD